MTAILARNTCSTCALHVGAGNALYCRARPPTAVPIMGPDPNNPHQPALLGQFAIFPRVQADWWCGEFKAVVLRGAVENEQRPIDQSTIINGIPN